MNIFGSYSNEIGREILGMLKEARRHMSLRFAKWEMENKPSLPKDI